MRGRSLWTITMVLATLWFPSRALASIEFDQNLTNGVLFGSGNANGSWTTDRSNGIELGLRAKVRFPTPMNVFNSNGDGTYSHLAGTHPPGRALWNYEFGADVDFLGTSDRELADTDIFISIDTDPTTASSFVTFDIDLFGDNEPSGHLTIAQNSQNLGFLPFAPLYNFNADATYTFGLTAFDIETGDQLAQTFIDVIVGEGGSDPAVPELASGLTWLSLLGAASVWAACKQRREKQPR